MFLVTGPSQRDEPILLMCLPSETAPELTGTGSVLYFSTRMVNICPRLGADTVAGAGSRHSIFD